MRPLLTLFLLLAMAFFVAPAGAQIPGNGVYEVTDVGVDVTADSAVHARNQAVKQGQRTALEQLLQRLDADPALIAKLSDDDIAAMVQSFEVQNERSSTVRYLGTFTVQFRPSAVRGFLDNRDAAYTDVVSKPIIVLPVVMNNGHPTLWEESTKWRAAWDAGSHSGGLVPVVVPQGGLDDIALLSTEESVVGKSDSLAALINKYQGGGALVAILTGDLSKAGNPVTVETHRYDGDGHSLSNATISLTVPADKKDADTAVLAQAVKQARSQLEAEWKQNARSEATAATPKNSGTEDAAATTVPTSQPPLPTSHLPVNVPIATLAEWEQIRQRLDHIPSIARADIIVLARGFTNIEIEFTGDIPQLQSALAAQSLSLTQDRASGAWTLQSISPLNPGSPAHAPS